MSDFDEISKRQGLFLIISTDPAYNKKAESLASKLRERGHNVKIFTDRGDVRSGHARQRMFWNWEPEYLQTVIIFAKHRETIAGALEHARSHIKAGVKDWFWSNPKVPDS